MKKLFPIFIFCLCCAGCSHNNKSDRQKIPGSVRDVSSAAADALTELGFSITGRDTENGFVAASPASFPFADDSFDCGKKYRKIKDAKVLLKPVLSISVLEVGFSEVKVNLEAQLQYPQLSSPVPCVSKGGFEERLFGKTIAILRRMPLRDYITLPSETQTIRQLEKRGGNESSREQQLIDSLNRK